ncbi:hypothetical protein EMIHUDRAFT_73174 [Emiliania huxleyi CCMP1516]|uniref:GTP cyclohydrolase 1 n=2 Tax=Emiliania huxleyi TaxID=2903 RepID=A0A0D3JXC0_EMIH1|nr:hypothetical protein EMIHUDRAFT_73174 [Emiliania huxleyi CCMP1516]EOD28155.1 hypothetical protein EMIHUDRAFT_73174 [Emiliania huxleyi CCMP1516]|eukprot:XP_005780584.1 hypothetical protein EMIHUDRAFT_73174 [Emiliania huxleyi CCMP1516]
MPPTQQEAEAAIRTLIEYMGDDPNREGLKSSPRRSAKALRFLTAGYGVDVEVHTLQKGGAAAVSGIEIYSLCEHHLLPFFGTRVELSQPPSRVVGLSKLARVANAFARRLQIQARTGASQCPSLARQVLQPRGIRVVLECTHMCMSMRGVQQPRAVTAT